MTPRPGLVNLLFIGDIVGRPGRMIVARRLPELIDRYAPELVIANVENASGGRGLTHASYKELTAAGVDVCTSGNHIWEKKDAYKILDTNDRVLRPANYSRRAPGLGHGVFSGRTGKRIGVINLSGRVFMDPIQVAESPFDSVETALAQTGAETRVVLVDIHAEATSEKVALGWYLNGRVSAVVGTHTHVQTADQRILPGGTAYITDAGMTGPTDSVIGMRKTDVIERFLAGTPRRLEVARTGRLEISGVIVSIDYRNGRAMMIERLQEVEEE